MPATITRAILALAALTALQAQVYWNIDPMRGPVDLGLTDPALIGAIDVHEHLDPDAPGVRGQIRALDAFDAATLAKSRGMRGFVIKTHQDAGSAGAAYLVRKHVQPGFEAFARMASNLPQAGSIRRRSSTSRRSRAGGDASTKCRRATIAAAPPVPTWTPNFLPTTARGCC
jgi:hypothetical protein